ncbi:MAG: WGxxGxxG family protein [Chitinophagaceae bacterium]
MKKLTKIIAMLVLSFMLGISSPVIAQNDVGTTTTTTRDDDDEGFDDWGLLGLAGLLGLLGLRKDDDKHRVHRTTDHRTTDDPNRNR